MAVDPIDVQSDSDVLHVDGARPQPLIEFVDKQPLPAQSKAIDCVFPLVVWQLQEHLSRRLHETLLAVASGSEFSAAVFDPESKRDRWPFLMDGFTKSVKCRVPFEELR